MLTQTVSCRFDTYMFDGIVVGLFIYDASVPEEALFFVSTYCPVNDKQHEDLAEADNEIRTVLHIA